MGETISLDLRREMLERIAATPWFSRVGQPLGDPSGKVDSVENWREVARHLESESFYNLEVKAGNLLVDALGRNVDRDSYRAVRQSAKMAIGPKGEALIRKIAKERRLSSEYLVGIQIMVAAAAVEDAMEAAGLSNVPSLNRWLFSFYEAGHVPCGWRGKDWPDGVLLVY